MRIETLVLCGCVAFVSGCSSFTVLFTSANTAVDDYLAEATIGTNSPLNSEILSDENVDLGDWVVDIDKPNPNEWMPVTEDLNFPVVYFGYNQDRLGESGRTKLKRVATYMTEQERVGLIIQGHSDERGSDEYNRALSERRAIAVRDYLVSSGIQNVRVRTIGYGEERPAVSGDSMSSMAKNRRAQLVPAYIP